MRLKVSHVGVRVTDAVHMWVRLFCLVGLQYIKQLCVPEFNSVEMEVGTK